MTIEKSKILYLYDKGEDQNEGFQLGPQIMQGM